MKANKVRYTLRINKYLLEKLGYIADSEARSKNKEIEHMIKTRVKEFEKSNGTIPLK